MPSSSLSCLLLAASLGAAVPPRPYHVEHYDVSIQVDVPGKRLDGVVTIRFRSLVDQLGALELDAGDLDIAAVEDSLKFSRSARILTVSLKSPIPVGEQRTLTIRYRAKPSRGLVFVEDQVYTSFFTNDWMVCNDLPEDRATLRLTISAADGAKVVGSGRLASMRAEGSRTVTEWKVDSETPPFVFGFAVGDFVESSTEVDRVKLRYLGRKSPGVTVTEATDRAMRFLNEKTGVAFPGKTYTQAFVEGRVEQEVAGFTLLPEAYPEKLAGNPEDLWLLAHELAHQWYGIGIACKDWSDFWLNEGVATYLADAFLEARFGRERYEQEIEGSRKIYEALQGEGKDRALSYHDWNTTQEASGRLPYHKGAWVLHLLRHKMGDEKFWSGLRTYTRENWGKAVTSLDFQRSMESAAGASLAEFFKKWVY